MKVWTVAKGNQTVVLVDDSSNQMGILVFADGLEQAQANARLIAAAPDLLDAAQEILSDFQRYDEVLQVGDNGEYGLESAIGRLTIAITKAEPQQADEPERTG